MEYIVSILMNEFVTHNVRRFVVEKPGLSIHSGSSYRLYHKLTWLEGQGKSVHIYVIEQR